MTRIPRFRLLLPHLWVLAPFFRILAKTIQLLVHLGHNLAQRLAFPLFIFGKLWVLVVLLGLVFSLVVGLELLVLGVALILLSEEVCVLLTTTEADAVAVTITSIHGGAVDFVAGEDVVPDVFEDAARELVVHGCGKQPLAVVFEAFNGHLSDALPGNGKLGTADAGEGGGHLGTRVDLLPDRAAPVDFLGLVVEVEVGAGTVHVDPVGAARVVMAAHVHIAHAGDALVVEALEHGGGVETEQHVVVPGAAVGVHEDGRVGKIMVVVDDVAEVDLGREGGC